MREGRREAVNPNLSWLLLWLFLSPSGLSLYSSLSHSSLFIYFLYPNWNWIVVPGMISTATARVSVCDTHPTVANCKSSPSSPESTFLPLLIPDRVALQYFSVLYYYSRESGRMFVLEVTVPAVVYCFFFAALSQQHFHVQKKDKHFSFILFLRFISAYEPVYQSF